MGLNKIAQGLKLLKAPPSFQTLLSLQVFRTLSSHSWSEIVKGSSTFFLFLTFWFNSHVYLHAITNSLCCVPWGAPSGLQPLWCHSSFYQTPQWWVRPDRHSKQKVYQPFQCAHELSFKLVCSCHECARGSPCRKTHPCGQPSPQLRQKCPLPNRVVGCSTSNLFF